MMKVCSKCGIEKVENEFHRNAARPDGKMTWCKACVQIKTAKYRATNAAKCIAATRKWQRVNPSKTKAAYRRWYTANPESHVARRRREYAKNPAAVLARNTRRKAAKLHATPIWANKFFIEEAYDLAQRRSALKTGGHAKWHVDHIVPLKHPLVCGLHVEHNLQVIPAAMNIAKSNRWWPDMPEAR